MGDFAQIKKFQRNFQQKNPHEMHFNSCPHTPSEKNRDGKRTVFKDSKTKTKRDFKVLKISQAVQTLNSEPVEENFLEFRPLSPNFISSRESPINFQEKQIQMVQCPLNDPDLPPVSEIDHQSSRCYCDLCNCGSHVCPYSRRTSLYPASVFRTQYNNNFLNKGTPKQEKINVLQGYKLTNNSKLEVLTTKMQDFQPIQLPKNFNPYAEMQLNRPSTTVLPQKFCCATQYQHNFPNWGPTNPYYEKEAHLKIKTDELHLEGKTNYTLSYRNPFELLSPSQKNSQKELKTSESFNTAKIFKAPYAMVGTAPFNNKTSYRTNLCYRKALSLNMQDFIQEIHANKVPPQVYKTTYQSIFKDMRPLTKFPIKGGKKKFF